jgi:MFS family permease
MNTINSAASSGANRATANRYNLVIGIFLATVNVGFVVTSFGIFFKPVSEDFGWTRATTSGAFSLCTIMSGLFGILAGRLADRYSPRIVILICGILQGGSYLLLSQMTSVWQLYLYFGILTGAGMANIIPASTLVTKWFHRQRGRMTGIALSGAAFSSIFAPYLAAWLIESYNWHISYVVIGILCLVILAVSTLFMFRAGKEEAPSDNRLSGPESQQTDNSMDFREILGTWEFWCLAAIYFCFHFALSVVQVHIVPHATDLGISSVLAASVLAVANGANVVGSFSLGSINDKIGSRKSLIMGLAILLGGSMLLLISNTFWMLCLFAVIFGFAWGGVGSLRSVIIAGIFGLRSTGVSVAVLFFIGLIGGTVSPILSGYIFDITGQYRIAFLLTIGLALIALILSFFLSHRFRHND